MQAQMGKQKKIHKMVPKMQSKPKKQAIQQKPLQTKNSQQDSEKTMKKQINVGYTKRHIKPKNSTLESNLKLIYGHNFSLKFPLKKNCRIPFNSNYFNYTKLPRGKFNVRIDYRHNKGFIRQTNKSLIIFPSLEKEAALPKNSFKLKARLAEKAFEIAKDLKAKNPGLLFSIPSRPSTQEYAIKDGYAKDIDFTFENELAKIDKSPHSDESGFMGTGGEIDWKSPEFADAYIRMPLIFKESLKEYNANIRLHLETLGEMKNALASIASTIKALKPRRLRLPTSFKNSATKRSVN